MVRSFADSSRSHSVSRDHWPVRLSMKERIPSPVLEGSAGRIPDRKEDGLWSHTDAFLTPISTIFCGPFPDSASVSSSGNGGDGPPYLPQLLEGQMV